MSQSHAGAPTGRTLMLVEDHPTLARVLGMVFTDAGYHVTTCSCGEEALQAFSATPDAWSVVVSDVTMPRLSGDRLALAMRGIRPDLPVILMSGNTNLVTPRRLQAIGAAAVLEKPIAIEDLVAAVDDAVSRRARHVA